MDDVVKETGKEGNDEEDVVEEQEGGPDLASDRRCRSSTERRVVPFSQMTYCNVISKIYKQRRETVCTEAIYIRVGIQE